MLLRPKRSDEADQFIMSVIQGNPDRVFIALNDCLKPVSAQEGFFFHCVDMRQIEERVSMLDHGVLSVLSEAELEYWESLTPGKNRTQWISGRYAVKQALFQLKNSGLNWMDTRCVDVLKSSSSAPYIVQYSSTAVSITHSHPYCIGIVSENKVGIDLEKTVGVEAALVHYFFSDAEKTTLEGLAGTNDYIARAMVYWTRKEALSKLLGLGMTMDFKNTDTTSDTLTVSGFDKPVRLISFTCEDYCVSLALG